MSFSQKWNLTFSDFSIWKIRATTLLVKNASRRLAVLSTAFWLNQNESDINSIGTVSVNIFGITQLSYFKQVNVLLPILSVARNLLIFVITLLTS